MSDPRHQLSKTFISNVELEAIKKKNADLQFCLDKEVARVMELTQQNAELLDINEKLLDAMITFCERVDKGEARSKRTYDQFMKLIQLSNNRLAITKAGVK